MHYKKWYKYGDPLTQINERHGMKNTPEYRTWIDMKKRCYNANSKDYKDYGQRGITVCDKWLHSFLAFYEDIGKRPVGLSIDRIDVDGNYESSNCKWSTPKEQARNRRSNRLVTIDGITKVLAEWIEESTISTSKFEHLLYDSKVRVEDIVSIS